MINRFQLKREAKASMHGKKPNVFLVSLFYLLILYVLNVLVTRMTFNGLDFDRLLRLADDPSAFSAYIAAWAERGSSTFSKLLDFVISVMRTVLAFGFCSFALNVSRNMPAGYGDLFDGFGIFFKCFFLQLVMGIFVFLWSLLFVIPGIVASYRYSLAVYVLLDDPDKGIMQCIRESKSLTKGYKWQLFMLDLSFIGWWILCLVPFVSIYVKPYYEVSKANYYRVISGRTGAQYDPSFGATDDAW